MSIKNERWLPVVGFEGMYEVSDRGRVRSIDRTQTYHRIDQYSGDYITVIRHLRGRILRPAAADSGHLSVVLGRSGGTKQIHALVLSAFVGPCPKGSEGCHRDDVPSNNNLDNLRWGTRSENLLDAVRNGKKPIGEDHSGAKLKNSDIPVIRSLFNVMSFSAIGRKYGVKESTIRQIKNNRSWKHIPKEDRHAH